MADSLSSLVGVQPISDLVQSAPYPNIYSISGLDIQPDYNAPQKLKPYTGPAPGKMQKKDVPREPLEDIPTLKTPEQRAREAQDQATEAWRKAHPGSGDGQFAVPENAPDDWMPDMDAPGLHIPDAMEDMFFGKGDVQVGAKGYLEQMYGGPDSQGIRNINRSMFEDMSKEQLDKLYWQLEEMVGKSGIDKLKDIRKRLKKMESAPQS
jgi:hypothetical protein